jgi:hypothetical protein
MEYAGNNQKIAPFYFCLPEIVRMVYVQNKPVTVHFESLDVASWRQFSGRQLVFGIFHDPEQRRLRDKKSSFGAYT